MHKEAREELQLRFKLVVLAFAEYFSVSQSCEEFNVPL